MSRFSGPQGKGATRKAKELRMWEAAARQMAGVERGTAVRTGLPHSYSAPFEFLTESAIEEMVRTNRNLRSYWPRRVG